MSFELISKRKSKARKRHVDDGFIFLRKHMSLAEVRKVYGDDTASIEELNNIFKGDTFIRVTSKVDGEFRMFKTKEELYEMCLEHYCFEDYP